MAGVVKATVESTLGRLGTVGAVAVDDFIQRLVSAVSQLRPVSGSRVAVSGDDVPVTPTLPAAVVSVGSVVPVTPSVASLQESVAPSLFGESAVVGPARVAKSTGVTPGKNLIRSLGGLKGKDFSVDKDFSILRVESFFRELFQHVRVYLFVAARTKKIKTLEPFYFVSSVVGTFVGFPRNKRVIDGYARCLLCRADLSIAGRRISSLWDPWKGVEHTRLEQKYRTMTHRPLLDKPCRPVSADEDHRIRLARSTEPPVFMETDLNLTVEERMAIEEVEATEGARPHLPDDSVGYLWLSNFISSFLVASFSGCLAKLHGEGTAFRVPDAGLRALSGYFS